MEALLLSFCVWIAVLTFLLSLVAVYYWIRRNPKDAATAMGAPLVSEYRDPIEERCAALMEQLTRSIPYDIDASARAVLSCVADSVIEEALEMTRRIAPMIQHATPTRAGENPAAKIDRAEREFLDRKVLPLYRRSVHLMVAKAREALDAIDAKISEPDSETVTLTEDRAS